MKLLPLRWFFNQIGALKAGVRLVFPRTEQYSTVKDAIESCQPSILFVSPFAPSYVDQQYRYTHLQEDIPELKGDSNTLLHSEKHPYLKQVIQISHKTLPKTNKFKHTLNYSGVMTTLKYPQVSPDEVAVEVHLEGSEKEELTHSQVLSNVEAVASTLPKHSTVLNTSSMSTASSLTHFLAAINSGSYTAFPSTYEFDFAEFLIKQSPHSVVIDSELAANVTSSENLSEAFTQAAARVEQCHLLGAVEDSALANSLGSVFPSASIEQINVFTGQKE